MCHSVLVTYIFVTQMVLTQNLTAKDLRRWSVRLNPFTTVKAEVTGCWVLSRVDICCAAFHLC